MEGRKGYHGEYDQREVKARQCYSACTSAVFPVCSTHTCGTHIRIIKCRCKGSVIMDGVLKNHLGEVLKKK
jgi:hypothetical protein